MEKWREQLYLEHSAKGTTWGKHKYIAIKNGRYIYPSTSANSNSIPTNNPGKSTMIEDYARVGRNIGTAAKKAGNKVSSIQIDPDKKEKALRIATALAGGPMGRGGVVSTGLHGYEEYKKRKLRKGINKARKKKSRSVSYSGAPLSALQHSAKGTTWDKHKYIKKEDGVYFYPDSYADGRHLEDKIDKKSGGSKLEDWEVKIHKHIETIVNQHPELFGTSEKVAENIMNPGAMEAFKGTLKALTGMDPNKMSEAELNRMRKKIADYYIHNTGAGNSASKATSKKKTTKQTKTNGPAYNQGISKNTNPKYSKEKIQELLDKKRGR